MKSLVIFLQLFLLAGFLPQAKAQTGQPSTEKIWKDLSRLPQTLRDDLKKSSWSKVNAVTTHLDSIVTLTNFSNGKFFPINKSAFEYPSAQVAVQSDFVNYGQWILEKRTTLTYDAQKRITEVTVEEPDQNTGTQQPSAKTSLFWHGASTSQLDSILTYHWDDQWQQWTPEIRLISFFDAQNREVATETYRYDEGFQVIGIREENQFDGMGDITGSRQFLAKDGSWSLLGKVESKFDKLHHEIARQEDVAVDANRFAAVRKLTRSFDAKGNLTTEERFKWDESSKTWAPLKTLSKGTAAKTRSEWTATESFKRNASFKSKVENFSRAKDDNPEREVHSMYKPESKSWQVLSETRYYYAK